MRSVGFYYKSILFLCLLLDGLIVVANAIKYEAEQASYQSQDMSVETFHHGDTIISGASATSTVLVQFETNYSYLLWPSVQLGTASEISPSDVSFTNNGLLYRITIRYLPLESKNQQPLDLIIQRKSTEQELIADPTLAEPKVIHYRMMNPNPETTELLTETREIQLKDGLYEFRLHRPEALRNGDNDIIGPNIDFLDIEQEDVFGDRSSSSNSSPSINHLGNDGKQGITSQSTNANANQQGKYYYSSNANQQNAITLAAHERPEEYWLIQRRAITAKFEEGDLPEIIVTYQVHQDLLLNEIEYTLYTSDCKTIVDDSGVVSSSISFGKTTDMDSSSSASAPSTKSLLLSIDINEADLHLSNIWQQQEQDSRPSTNEDGGTTVAVGDDTGAKMTGSIMLCARIDLISSTTTTQQFVFRQSKSLLETSWLQPLHMSTSFGLQPFEIAQIQDEMLLLNTSPNFDNFITSCVCNRKYECLDNTKNKVLFQVNSQLHICLRTTPSNQNIQIQQVSNWILEQELPMTSKPSNRANNLMMYFTAIEDSTPNALTTVKLLHENSDGSTIEDSDKVTNLAYLTTQLIVEFFENADDSQPNDIHLFGSVQLSFTQQTQGSNRTRRSATERSATLTEPRRRHLALPRSTGMLRQRDLGSEDGESDQGSEIKPYNTDRMSDTVLSDVFEMSVSLEPSTSSAATSSSILQHHLISALAVLAASTYFLLVSL